LKLSNANHSYFGYFNIGDSDGNLFFYTTVNAANNKLTNATVP
jgi:hypothetical protein